MAFLEYLDSFRYLLAGEFSMQTPFVPSWNRVISTFPCFLSQFEEAVAQDNQI